MLAARKETDMHSYFRLVSEVNHRHFEHERRVKAAAVDALTASTNQSGLSSHRNIPDLIRSVALSLFPFLATPSPRVSLGEQRAGSFP